MCRLDVGAAFSGYTYRCVLSGFSQPSLFGILACATAIYDVMTDMNYTGKVTIAVNHDDDPCVKAKLHALVDERMEFNAACDNPSHQVWHYVAGASPVAMTIMLCLQRITGCIDSMFAAVIFRPVWSFMWSKYLPYSRRFRMACMRWPCVDTTDPRSLGVVDRARTVGRLVVLQWPPADTVC